MQISLQINLPIIAQHVHKYGNISVGFLDKQLKFVCFTNLQDYR